MRTYYKEANIEEDIDGKIQYRIKNIKYPTSIRDACSKNYVDDLFRNDINFNDVKLENTKIVRSNYQPVVNEHLTPKTYVDTAKVEMSLYKIFQDTDFNNHNLSKTNSIFFNTQVLIDNQVITKAYVDQFHHEKEHSARILGIDFNIGTT